MTSVWEGEAPAEPGPAARLPESGSRRVLFDDLSVGQGSPCRSCRRSTAAPADEPRLGRASPALNGSVSVIGIVSQRPEPFATAIPASKGSEVGATRLLSWTRARLLPTKKLCPPA